MVRFARAEGSKGSNKRQLEEPTPWVEMVEQIENTQKKKRKKETHKRKNYGSLEQTVNEKKQMLVISEQDKLQSSFQHIKRQRSELEKEKNKQAQAVEDLVENKVKKKKHVKTIEPEYTITSEGKRVKVFRDGTQKTWFDLPYEESDLMTRYNGMWVKQEMVEELDRLKSALEEEGLDKKEVMRKMMKAKRKAHRQLRIELIYQQKKLVSEAAGEEVKDGTSIRKNKGKKKNSSIPSSKKKKRKERLSKIENDLFSDRQLEPVETQRSECNVEDINSEELMSSVEAMGNCSKSEVKNFVKGLVTNQTIVKVKKKAGNASDNVNERSPEKDVAKQLISSLESNTEANSKGKDNMEITLTQQDDLMKCKEKLKKQKLKIEDTASQNDGKGSVNPDQVATEADLKTSRKNKKQELGEVAVSPSEMKDNNVSEAKSCNSFSSKDQVKSNVIGMTTKNPNSHWDFEENELMTNFDGYWVLCEDVENLETAKKMELDGLYATRSVGFANCKGELTQEEQLSLQRAMKKKKRFHHRKLLKKLSSMGKRVSNSENEKGNKNRKEIKGDSDKGVKFDGFWVKKEAADRLHKLRQKLYKEGLSQQEVNSVVQKERRKEEKILKNERKLVCLNCRQPGHMVSACPNIVQAEGESQPSICYTCGSTEHTSSSCNLRKESGKSFSFATCYICKESGHISRQCPDNPRGLYPKGGACRGCGSVEHLAKDCPDLQKEKEENNIRVGRLKGEELELLDAEAESKNAEDEVSSHIKKNNCKVVKF